MCVCVFLYVYFYIWEDIFFIIQRVKARAIPCPQQPPARSDNTVSVAQGGTATRTSTEQLCHRTGYLKSYMPDQPKVGNYIVRSSSFLVQFVIFKTHLLSAIDVITRLQLRNHTGMVILHEFHTCWRLFALDQIQLDAYFTVVWRRYEATFNLYVCVYIYIYIYIYIYTCGYLCIYIYMCVCVCVYIYIYKYINTHTVVWRRYEATFNLYVCVCIYIYIYICGYLCIYIYVCVCVCVCIYIFINI